MFSHYSAIFVIQSQLLVLFLILKTFRALFYTLTFCYFLKYSVNFNFFFTFSQLSMQKPETYFVIFMKAVVSI